LRVGNFRDYIGGNFLALVGRQAVTAVAIWQVSQWTHSATALGLVGLVNILPLLALSLPAGVIADRHDRRRLIALGAVITAVVNVGLAALSLWHTAVPALAPLNWINGLLRTGALLFERHADPATLHFDQPALPLVYALLCAHAAARILTWPARSSITPLLVPTATLSNAITWSTSMIEIATVAGPALGGFLVALLDIPAVYALGAALELMFLPALGRVTYFQPPPTCRNPAQMA
jgi:MFS family permease